MLDEAAACAFFCHILSALRHAHSRGFLHCDVKPQNVRLDRLCERAVLVDWGMARHRDRQAGLVISQGSPAYASPEQLTGHNVDDAFGAARLLPATDVWSLGATLYEMVVGDPPFGGESFDELVSNVLRLNYSLPDALSVDIRRVIDSVLQVIAPPPPLPTHTTLRFAPGESRPSGHVAQHARLLHGVGHGDWVPGRGRGCRVPLEEASQPCAPALPHDACAQVRPSERSSVDDLCSEPWVVASGALPDEAGACHPIPRSGSGSAADLESARGGDHDAGIPGWAAAAFGGRRTAKRGGGGGGCKQLAAGGGWRRVGLYLLYAALVVWALLANRKSAAATAVKGVPERGDDGSRLESVRTST